jgi:hypothetical protein
MNPTLSFLPSFYEMYLSTKLTIFWHCVAFHPSKIFGNMKKQRNNEYWSDPDKTTRNRRRTAKAMEAHEDQDDQTVKKAKTVVSSKRGGRGQSSRKFDSGSGKNKTVAGFLSQGTTRFSTWTIYIVINNYVAFGVDA